LFLNSIAMNAASLWKLIARTILKGWASRPSSFKIISPVSEEVWSEARFQWSPPMGKTYACYAEGSIPGRGGHPEGLPNTRKMGDPAGGVGTWSLQQDKDGNSILFNSKTAQTKAAPGNMVPKGTGQLTTATQKILQETTPVHDQVSQLLDALEPYKDDNTPGSLAPGRLKYALGMADPKGELGDKSQSLNSTA
jgi:hypothetical protein